MGDLKSPRLILLKGFLFIATGVLAAGLLVAEHPDLRTALLIAIAVWSFCRFYYFAFYVIERYIDADYRFAGLGSFFRYLWRRRSTTATDRRPARQHLGPDRSAS